MSDSTLWRVTIDLSHFKDYSAKKSCGALAGVEGCAVTKVCWVSTTYLQAAGPDQSAAWGLLVVP